MDLDQFDAYQALSIQTDQQSRLKNRTRSRSEESGLLIPLLGLAGETGTLLSEFKKRLRDGQKYEGFHDKAKEELGDILWYLSNVASRLNVSLSDVARNNLKKTQERWPIESDSAERPVFDADYPASEQLPRKARIRIFQDQQGNTRLEWVQKRCLLGDKLTDNAYEDDGYRFHDVMHLAHWAILGWSPVMRKMIGAKRKSKLEVDDVEDGARALIIEELLVAYVYSDARKHALYKGVRHLDSELLATIKKLVLHLEVRQRPARDWEQAIKQGYKGFRYLKENGEATFEVDVKRRQLRVVQ